MESDIEEYAFHLGAMIDCNAYWKGSPSSLQGFSQIMEKAHLD